MIEVELKYQVAHISLHVLRRWLEAMEFLETLNNTDIYYDTPEFELLQQAVFVRSRNHLQLQAKFNEMADATHTQCHELSFSLTDANQQEQSAMNAFFERFLPRWRIAPDFATAIVKNELIELVRIQNTRSLYREDDIVVSVDHVEGLGQFLELEIQCEEQADVPEAMEKLRSFAAHFDLPPLNVGYVELWLRLHNPQAYALGKYQLK